MKSLKNKPKLIIFCGLPGSGKTTNAKRLEHELPAVRLCPDEWMDSLKVDLYDEEFRTRLEVKLWEHALILLRLGQNVILENGLWSRKERDDKRHDVVELDIDVELHYLDVPFDELWRRIKARNAAGGHGIVSIARKDLGKYAKMFEPPSREELMLFTRSVIYRP